ncbi:hypothetical protein OBBRIDRAFT_814832 [Obba rivulosa]|uniref:Uncharacterized protein n=1 Tax=Obba rivulosa TaxID=1052685 RepID=A0A8E2DHM3_9APHY|nr:hypothetical protein OBBRIDRAFT_814832 [Obba rivulosa]
MIWKVPPQVLEAYKTIDMNVRPISGVFSEEAQFVSSLRLTRIRLATINVNPNDFHWPEEVKLFHYILRLNNHTLAFSEKEKGTLQKDYFSPYIILVEPHVLWAEQNIPISLDIKEKVIQLLKQKIDAGQNSTYSQCIYR